MEGDVNDRERDSEMEKVMLHMETMRMDTHEEVYRNEEVLLTSIKRRSEIKDKNKEEDENPNINT